MWLQHLFSFLGTVLRVFFDAIGTTFLGRLVDLAFAASIAIAALRGIHREKGWKAVINHWQENYKAGVKFALWCALIIYSPVIIWSVGKAVYDDHTGLIRRFTSMQNEKENLKGQISEWRVRCSALDARNDTLNTQNRDQQNTINNCQDKALRLLMPSELHIDQIAVAVNYDQKSDISTYSFLLLTNKVISPIRLKAKCNRDIIGALATSVELSTTQIGRFSKAPDKDTVDFGFDAPSWTPRLPITAHLNFRGAQSDVDCKITTN